jgi:hypothetical protein
MICFPFCNTSIHICITAGQQQDMDVHPTGLCSTVLGKLLKCYEICKHVPGKERVRCMRYLYTMLQCASQRIAEQVRAQVGTPPVSQAGSCAACLSAVAALACAKLWTSICARANKTVRFLGGTCFQVMFDLHTCVLHSLLLMKCWSQSEQVGPTSTYSYLAGSRCPSVELGTWAGTLLAFACKPHLLGAGRS